MKLYLLDLNDIIPGEDVYIYTKSGLFHIIGKESEVLNNINLDDFVIDPRDIVTEVENGTIDIIVDSEEKYFDIMASWGVGGNGGRGARFKNKSKTSGEPGGSWAGKGGDGGDWGEDGGYGTKGISNSSIKLNQGWSNGGYAYRGWNTYASSVSDKGLYYGKIN